MQEILTQVETAIALGPQPQQRPEEILRLAKIFRDRGDSGKAKVMLKFFLDNFPAHAKAGEARRALEELER